MVNQNNIVIKPLLQKLRFTFIKDILVVPNVVFMGGEVMLVNETPSEEGLTMEGGHFYRNSMDIKITNKKKVQATQF